MRLLARREHGAHELANKLATKGYPESDIQDVLLTCQSLGLQSDSRFVDNLCRTRIRQGYGPLRIRQELQHLQIDAELVLEQDNWLAHASAVWKKKYKEFKEPKELSFAESQKQKQFLHYRGFSTDTITMLFNAKNSQ